MRKVGLGLTLFFLSLYLVSHWLPEDDSAPEGDTGSVNEQSAEGLSSEIAPDILSALAPESAEEIVKEIVKEHTFKSGDSLFAVLSVLGIPDAEIFDIMKAAKKVYDLRKIIPGQKIIVFLEEAPQAVGKMLYQIDPFRSLKVERSENGFNVVEEKTPLERDLVSHNGVISDTLYESARRSGVPAEVILDLSDIFAWDVDFSTEIQSGGHFRVVYEVFKNQEQILRTGRVLAAELMNEGETYRAYHFSNDGGKGDYYDENGRSLKKAFLKSPLRYRYISSGFTTKRFHPVLKVNRPHLGVDYAAPRGTPVMAASDGTVKFVGWNGGHGKTVIIQHRNGYSTLYGHLSSYGEGIRKGKKVAQGEMIGRVGSTGLSTGPHLHYTLMRHGNPINPKNADVVRGEPLPKTWEAPFKENVEEMNRHLDSETRTAAEGRA
ncbi:MAG: peptidoglycan DD-metalloendopeptidase family protein [Candidatus Manganitrophus sp. SA1]|nr:peptidoglycan DD-metalloendopeptidase family protein [Candidatus Manganitrophus morganii]